MPSIGLCLLVVTGARRIAHRLQHKVSEKRIATPTFDTSSLPHDVQFMKRLLHLILAGLVVVMAAKTHTRNKVIWVQTRKFCIIISLHLF